MGLLGWVGCTCKCAYDGSLINTAIKQVQLSMHDLHDMEVAEEKVGERKRNMPLPSKTQKRIGQ
ncbi:hypothetical protein Prudu_002736 [Prunus dulcis]|uniref:Uncharacterized protein n=1 Tax=Prunus dulcis TaxID=3755 RepID=A0A4Y1QRI8_PRUDU|nr:hypothetical protein Prudu_002736 [Prunus dulcis]